MCYWIKEDLPIVELFRVNHTIFSEESGEIALSVLVYSQPPSGRADIKETRKYWHLTRQRYVALHSSSARLWSDVTTYHLMLTLCLPV